jgi:hypothetical protein
MEPEIKLILMLGASAASFHATKSLTKSIGLEGIVKGWSEQMKTNSENYDDVFGELYEKYKGPGTKMEPEIKLILMLGASAASFHATKSLTKSIGLEGIVKGNPDIMSKLQSTISSTIEKNIGAKTEDDKPLTSEQIQQNMYKKKNFNQLNEEYNKLHGYNSNEKLLNIKEFNDKLEELIEDRKKEIIKLKKINKKEFEKEFEKVKRSEDDISNDLIPYNLDLVLLNNINNISKLYDTGETEINKRFLLNNLPKYVENKLSYEDQIKNYKSKI